MGPYCVVLLILESLCTTCEVYLANWELDWFTVVVREVPAGSTVGSYIPEIIKAAAYGSDFKSV